MAPLHPQAKEFLSIVGGAPQFDSQSLAQSRAEMRQAIALTGTPAEVHKVVDTTLDPPQGPIQVRVYWPLPSENQPVLIYFHGGGWVAGDLDLADTTARDIAIYGDLVVISVDYRLAPENPHPAAVDDALAVTRSVLAGGIDGIDRFRVAVGGDSAGGNLAAVVAQQLRHEPGLIHQVLVYPVTQATVGATESYRRYGEDHFVTSRAMKYFFGSYAPNADPTDPTLAPLANLDLTGLPAATVVTAECDPLCDESEAYAAAMQAAGVAVEYRRYDGQVHPFLYMAGVVDDAVDARRFIGEALRRVMKSTHS
ncbi:alpha/beta hydrolase [Mycobacterium genavense]|uniref:alpha/beta hydrolase n=1 Tax=Mycobacterium genavense TaxID=36812 RepID=UPI00056203E0|nr:alpha/beta hydrolase [Mycobacterium genavense]